MEVVVEIVEAVFKANTPMYRNQRTLRDSLDLAWIDYRHRTLYRDAALAWLEEHLIIFRKL